MTSLKQPDLTIVIPAYSEEKRIDSSLDELAMFLKADRFFKQKEVEVIVVAADVPDKTHEILLAKRKLFKRFKLLKPGQHVGKGRDVRYGMLHASGKIIVFMDADLATPLHHLEKFYKACQKDNDVVIGTRNLFKYRPNLTRRIVSSIGNILFRLVSGVWIEDSQCGFKMFNKYAAQLCFSKMSIMEWGFDMEVLTIAKVNGLKMKSYRINDWRDMPNSTFTEGLFSTSLRSLRDLGRIVINRINGTYK